LSTHAISARRARHVRGWSLHQLGDQRRRPADAVPPPV